MAESNSGLLIAALVAIVAVVGLVILFKGGTTGNAVCPPGHSASYQMASSGLICEPLVIASDGYSSFDRPYGHSGEWRKYPFNE